jgi:hypothetical protein
MRRLVLVCLLMLLPLQWSVAATGWHGPHPAFGTSESPWPLGEMAFVAPEASAEIVASGATSSVADGHACSSDCHVDDPLWLGGPLSGVPPRRATPSPVDYCPPICSHIPAGPERPDRLPAA